MLNKIKNLSVMKKIEDLSVTKKIENMKVATVKILNFSKQTIEEMNQEEKVNEIFHRINLLNKKGQEYEEIEIAIIPLTRRIDLLKEIKNECSTKLNSITDEAKIEAMGMKIELKARIEVSNQEIQQLVTKREVMQKEADLIKEKYIKEFYSLNKLLERKEGQNEKRMLLKAVDTRSFVDRFADAVDKFYLDLLALKESSAENLISFENIKVYEQESIVEAKIDILEGSFVVSINNSYDSVKIAILEGGNSIKLIGKGTNFDDIQWFDDEFGDHYVIKFYDVIKEAKKQLEKQEEVYSGLQHIHLAM